MAPIQEPEKELKSVSADMGILYEDHTVAVAVSILVLLVVTLAVWLHRDRSSDWHSKRIHRAAKKAASMVKRSKNAD